MLSVAAGGTLSGTYAIEVTFATATGESNPGLVSAPILVNAQNIVTDLPAIVDASVIGWRIYGFKYGVSSIFQLIATITDMTQTNFTVTTDQPSWGLAPPSYAYDWPSLPVGIVAYQFQSLRLTRLVTFFHN